MKTKDSVPRSETVASGNAHSFETVLEQLKQLKAQGAGLDLSQFSWEKSQEMLKDIPGNFSDLLIEERDS